jgi:hypothetical protein
MGLLTIGLLTIGCLNNSLNIICTGDSCFLNGLGAGAKILPFITLGSCILSLAVTFGFERPTLG